MRITPSEPTCRDDRDNGNDYERHVTFTQGDSGSSIGFNDCYRRGAFTSCWKL
jgi:hypothetical protein